MDNFAVRTHDFYTFILVFARVSCLLVAAPLLGNRAIPHMVKAGLCLLLSIAITPMVTGITGPVPENLILFAGTVLKDGLFGLALGYLARILFAAVEMAGYLADTQMGFTFANIFNPFTEHQESLLSSFQYQVTMTVYLILNGHLILLGSVVDSFKALAPGTVSPNASFALTVVPMLNQMFLLGMRVAMPAVGVLLVVDVAFGLVARMVPQINIYIVGMPAKIIIGMSIVAMLLPMLSMAASQMIAGTTIGMNALIGGAK